MDKQGNVFEFLVKIEINQCTVGKNLFSLRPAGCKKDRISITIKEHHYYTALLCVHSGLGIT